jgi:hypothetical protein
MWEGKFSSVRGWIYGEDIAAIGYRGKFLKHSLAHESEPVWFTTQLCSNLAHVPRGWEFPILFQCLLSQLKIIPTEGKMSSPHLDTVRMKLTFYPSASSLLNANCQEKLDRWRNPRALVMHTAHRTEEPARTIGTDVDWSTCASLYLLLKFHMWSVFFPGTGVWTQGLHLEPLHQPFFVIFFFSR